MTANPPNTSPADRMRESIRESLMLVATDGWSGDACAVGMEEAIEAVMPVLLSVQQGHFSSPSPVLDGLEERVARLREVLTMLDLFHQTGITIQGRKLYPDDLRAIIALFNPQVCSDNTSLPPESTEGEGRPSEVRDANGVIQRLICRLEDLLEVCRQWEPDHSSAEDRRLLFFAREARDAAQVWLKRGVYRQAGPIELNLDQARLARDAQHSVGGSESKPSAVSRGAETIFPADPTREMWAAMGNAVIALSREFNGQFPAHDVVSDAIYRAARSVAPQGELP